MGSCGCPTNRSTRPSALWPCPGPPPTGTCLTPPSCKRSTAARTGSNRQEAPMEEIPVIDIGPFLAAGAPPPPVEAIREACTRVGFLQITGHGVLPETLDAVYRSM